MKRITVIGAGGTGQAAAADLTLAGHEVCLFEQAECASNLKPIQEKGGIHLKGAGRTGFARVHEVTSDISSIGNAEIVIVAVVANRHEEIASLCAPHLRDGQTLVIVPGNAGSLIFHRLLRKGGTVHRVLIAELEGALYPCRLVGPGEVLVARAYRPKHVAAFPAYDTEEVIGRLKGVYDTNPALNVFEAALNSPNVMVHLAASLLNLGGVERSPGGYCLYKSGLTPSVLRCIEAVHEEKFRLFERLGYRDNSPVEHIRKLARTTEFPELDLFRSLEGPTSVLHRYINEDAPTCVSLMISLGRLAGLPMPLSEALVRMASVLNQVDYYGRGRTLENLGLGGITVKELNAYLAEGEM